MKKNIPIFINWYWRIYEKYEVLATETFKKKEVRSPQMKAIGVRVENNLLQIDLSQIGIELSDLSEIMEKYKLKRHFID